MKSMSTCRLQWTAERPKISTRAEATETQNRSSFTIPEEYVEEEEIYDPEGALVQVDNAYDENDHRTLPIRILDDQEVSPLIPFYPLTKSL